MKKIVLLSALFFGLATSAQEFKITQSLIGDNLVYTKGNVTVTDTLITIDKSPLRVLKTIDTDSQKQYSVIDKVGDYQSRITLIKVLNSKKYAALLVLEIKDAFTEKISKTTYFLKPN